MRKDLRVSERWEKMKRRSDAVTKKNNTEIRKTKGEEKKDGGREHKTRNASMKGKAWGSGNGERKREREVNKQGVELRE